MPRCHLSLRQGSPRMQIQPIDLLTKRSQRDSWGFCDGALSPTVRVASPGDWTYKRVPWPTFSAFLKTSDRSSGYGMHLAAASAKQAPWELEQMKPKIHQKQYKNNWYPVPICTHLYPVTDCVQVVRGRRWLRALQGAVDSTTQSVGSVVCTQWVSLLSPIFGSSMGFLEIGDPQNHGFQY